MKKLYQNNAHEVIYMLNKWEKSLNKRKIIYTYWVCDEAMYVENVESITKIKIARESLILWTDQRDKKKSRKVTKLVTVDLDLMKPC
jgi:hypothetical protein